ncbi:MAG: hypothetical protein ACTHKQ_25935 [Mesorhizobium sp.]
MRPPELMWLGALSGFLLFGMSFFLPIVPAILIVVFAAGAVFGKGYGIWEERAARHLVEKGGGRDA